MAHLIYKVLHVTVGDEGAWEQLAILHSGGWRIEWEEYAQHQFHFLLVADDAG